MSFVPLWALLDNGIQMINDIKTEGPSRVKDLSRWWIRGLWILPYKTSHKYTNSGLKNSALVFVALKAWWCTGMIHAMENALTVGMLKI